jgi:GNAT superfamily N-acetyltransferase
MANMGYEIFKKFQRLQGGTEAVPSELPTPPDQPPDRGDRLRQYLFDQVRQGVLPDEALAEIKQNPTSLRSMLAYGEGALAAGTLLSGGEGGTPRGAKFSINPKTKSIEFNVDQFHPSTADFPEGRASLADKGVAGKMYLEEPHLFDTENPPPRDFMIVEDSVIAKPLQKQGYGTQLYNEALKLAKSLGYKGIASHEGDRNLASGTFWEKNSQGKNRGYDTITKEITRPTQTQPDAVPTVSTGETGTGTTEEPQGYVRGTKTVKGYGPTHANNT